jgi:hypothetical protein
MWTFEYLGKAVFIEHQRPGDTNFGITLTGDRQYLPDFLLDYGSVASDLVVTQVN